MNVQLHLGDCLEVMRGMADKSVDAVITDPPYVLDNAGGNNWSGRHEKQKTLLNEIDKGFEVDAFYQLTKRVCNPYQAYVFCSNKQIPETMMLGMKDGLITNLLIWNKFNSIPFSNGTWRSDAEFIVHIRDRGTTFNKGDSELKRKITTLPLNQTRYGHPTEKPIELMRKYILVSSRPGDTILDPFMGSGTTGVACVQTGRNFFGVEIDPTYFAIAERRIKDAQQQVRLPFDVNKEVSD